MSAAGHRKDNILLELENKQFSTWHRASSIGSMDICDLCLTVSLMFLLRPACINESQFPLLISNVTITLPLSGPDLIFELTTTQKEVTSVTCTYTQHFRHDIESMVITSDSLKWKKKMFKTCTWTVLNRLLWLSERAVVE